ncbi:Glyceraldehyde-3-phosphate dehydrogenase [Nosema granulosis]|uniref:Glyceraldehyde-3-phosphate dehydrogenase n=1 Tax=Nosema granulosis TaxID=83296 RepID=A0A9P6KZ90_9MICR|nr:Glyceraldehyde-3-phosphate dehydrogenase [Nosema granulosis]
MTLKVGINGFGRIGKHIFRILRERGVEVPLINDPFLDTSYVHYLLKYDSTFGKDEHVELQNDKIIYKGKPTVHSDKKDPSEIPWEKYGVEYVIEATGVFKTISACEGHRGVKKVIITAPSTDAPMFVYGVNHTKYNKEKIISNASCTTNCLAPLADIINKHFGIEEGLMTTVHAVTATQKIVDGACKKSKRDGRSGMQNIIPASTGAAKAVGKVLPELNGKLNGMSLRVPVPNVSIVDLSVRTTKSTSLEEIIKVIEEKGNKEIMGVSYDEVVSSDFNKDSRSCIFDAKASMELNKNFFKLLAWYDNEFGYSCRVCDLLEYVSKH